MSKHKKSIKPSMEAPHASEVKTTKQINKPITISYQYVKAGGDYCLSHCDKDEVRATVDCLRKLTTTNWVDVLKTGGKGENKSGLCYTTYEDHELKRATRPSDVSKDLKIGGVRATQKMRVLGVYHNHIFYLMWFDRNHKIVPY
jgi:hypothetical protein